MNVGYFLKRIAFALLGLLSITFLMFCLIQMAPDDAAGIMLRGSGLAPSDAAVDNLREQLGLNDFWLLQYIKWLGHLLQGDLGVSFSNGHPVAETMTPAALKTLELAVKAFLLTIMVSLPLGILAAKTQNRWPDKLVRFATYAYAAIPTFVVGIALLYAFCVRMRMFPAIANNHENGLVIPVIVLASTSIAWMVRQVRTVFMEKMNDSYVLGLQARGVAQWRIDLLYVLKNSMIPIVTSLGICFGSMLGGAVLVEDIFTWSGLGKTVLQAINALDYPMLMGFAIYIALIYFAINLAIDFFYGVFDPRIRKGAADIRMARRKRHKSEGPVGADPERANSEDVAVGVGGEG